MGWFWKKCGCIPKASISVDDICDKACELEIERYSKIEELDILDRELDEDEEQILLLEKSALRYEEKKKELERKESILLDRELEYKKCRDELDIARENFGEVAFEFKQNNQELDREISETKELKDNRERARNRILGIDKESNKLRGVIESQIQELSSKIDKLESI